MKSEGLQSRAGFVNIFGGKGRDLTNQDKPRDREEFGLKVPAKFLRAPDCQFDFIRLKDLREVANKDIVTLPASKLVIEYGQNIDTEICEAMADAIRKAIMILS